MPFNKALVRKIESKLKRAIVDPFEGTRSTYSPVSKSGAVRQRIETRLAALTPDLAPDVAFAPSGGYHAASLAFGGRWRKFEVKVASFTAAEQGRGANKYPYDVDVIIEIGYPTEPEVIVSGVTYDGADLKSSDDEQLDFLMRGGDLLSNPTVIADAQVIALGSAFDLGNTMRRHRYVMHVSRVYT